MMELVEQTSAVLMTALMAGGKGAAKDIFKGVILQGKDSVVKLWQDVFGNKPEAYLLADQVAAAPDNQKLQEDLRQMLRGILKKMPQDRLQQVVSGDVSIQIDEVKAENGGVAIGVNMGGNVRVHNNSTNKKP